ncbi:hypothetical protein PCASD_17763 [Puccinia coronata f. sp. avenae]|uniref:Uncharacterized protein n=1 Tax=Puccinia coronata f. sp. avenae TaxID=200324 RepID=A0A2N5TYU6_9BASI|nr:hypothetical protein PCASD_17763 [Puccinia coronata f. sp. avenae]
MPAAAGHQILKEGGLLFIIGAVLSHTYCGLPSYYNKNVKAMKGSIPLTIFDPFWKQQAAAHHAEKKTVEKGGSNERQYTGLPAPGEWTQSYAQWLRNYQGFIKALWDVYKLNTFSEWFQIHKDRCNNLMQHKGFCLGFRYGLARNKENGYINNLYLPGGTKENFNPHTGLEKTNFQAPKSNSEPKARGAAFQGRQQRGRWEPYQQEDDQGQGRDNGEGSQYRDNQDNRRDNRDRRDDRDCDSQEPSRQREFGDQVKGYKSQQGNPKETQQNQGKPL